MMIRKGDQRYRNHTKIGDKYKWKKNILGQDYNKRKSQLLNGSFYIYLGLLNSCSITKIKRVYTKDTLSNSSKDVRTS